MEASLEKGHYYRDIFEKLYVATLAYIDIEAISTCV